MGSKALKCHSGGTVPGKYTSFSTSSSFLCDWGNFTDLAVTWSKPGAQPVLSALTAEFSSSLVMGPCSNWGGDWKTGLQWKSTVVVLESVGDKIVSKWFLQPWSCSVGVSAAMMLCAPTFLPVNGLIGCQAALGWLIRLFMLHSMKIGQSFGCNLNLLLSYCTASDHWLVSPWTDNEAYSSHTFSRS